MRAHNPQLLAEVILYILYSKAITDGRGLLSSELAALLPSKKITDTLITFALNDLKQKKYVDYPEISIEGDKLTISRKGYDYARYRLSLDGSAINEFSKSPDWILGDEAPSDDAPIVDSPPSKAKLSEPETIPASDRIVSLKDNQPKVQEAKDAVDAVIKAVVGDNEFGAESPEKREALIGALKSGRILLDGDEIEESALQTFLISALQYVADNFAKGAISALAAAAVAKVLGLF